MTTRTVSIPKAEAAEKLREILPRGSRVYTVLRGLPSRSGMTRYIALYAIVPAKGGHPARPQWITGYAAAVIADGRMNDEHSALTVRGTGMDMGYHVVDSLSWALYGEGYALKHEWL